MKQLFLTLLFICLLPSYLFADVLVEWDPNQDADFYVVYWGTTPGEYTLNSREVATPKTEFLIPNPDNQDLYIMVKAFNKYGNSSDPSDELHYSYQEYQSKPDKVQNVKVKIVFDISLTVESDSGGN